MIHSLHLTPEGKFLENLPDEELRQIVQEQRGLLWVDLFKPTKDELFMLDDVFGFHPLAIEDCQHRSQLPKVDDFGSYLFVVFLAPNPKYDPHRELKEGEEEVDPVLELNIFWSANYVVTCHECPLTFLQGLLQRVRRDPKRVMGRGTAFLVHDLMDDSVDLFFGVVERYEKESEKLENALQKASDHLLLAKVFDLKGEVMNLRRQMNDHRELLTRLIRNRHPMVRKKAQMYFRNILDHLNRLLDDLEDCRDTLNGARDVHMAMANMQANEVMKMLTIVFTVSLPFSIITSWYGMNFQALPLQAHPQGPWILSGLMTGLMLVLILWLRRKRWF